MIRKRRPAETTRQSESCLARTASDVDEAAGDIPDDRFDRRSIETADPAGSVARLRKQFGDLHHEGFAEAVENVLSGSMNQERSTMS